MGSDPGMVRAVVFLLTPDTRAQTTIDKQAVPTSGCGSTRVVTDEQQVSETLQKEQIETEGLHPRR